MRRGLGVLVLVLGAVLGQKDGSACPPIDTGGDPVPSLCQGDTMNAGEAGAEYSVCRPLSGVRTTTQTLSLPPSLSLSPATAARLPTRRLHIVASH